MRSCAGLLVSSFDLFNVADLDLISQARAMCDRLDVAVLSDEAVFRATGATPVVPVAGRIALLGHVRGVDAVVLADLELPRFGAGDDTIVMTSTVANGLGASDVVLTSMRRSGSEFIRRLTPADALGHEAVA